MATLKIDWRWLRQTPPGTWGLLPREGLTWYHPHATPVQAEVVTVDLGSAAVTRLARGRQVPYEHGFDQADRAAIRRRCPDKLAATF